MKDMSKPTQEEIEEAQKKRWELGRYLIEEYSAPVIPLYAYNKKDKNGKLDSKAGKVPWIKGWNDQAPTALESFDEWEYQASDSNLGLVLGGTSGFIAIDVDGEEGKALLEKMSKGDLPPTVSYKTPGGGRRYLYLVPDEDRGKKFRKVIETGKQEHNECALLGDGQQTVLPYSIHPNGGIYTFLAGKSFDETEPAYAPQWMVDLMSPSKVLEGKEKGNKKETGKSHQNKNIQKNINDGELESNDNLEFIFSACPKLTELYREQVGGRGVDGETWHLITRLLTQVEGGSTLLALAFSKLSSKHDKRSIERIGKLEDEYDRNQGTVRCETLGCDEKQIKKCHEEKVNRNVNGEITNSPARKIKKLLIDEKNKTTEEIGFTFGEDGKLIDFNANKFIRYFLEQNKICMVNARKLKDIRYYSYSNSNYWYELSELGLIEKMRSLFHEVVPDGWTQTYWRICKNALPTECKKARGVEGDEESVTMREARDYINVQNGMFNPLLSI
jgi:hypothetical protein